MSLFNPVKPRNRWWPARVNLPVKAVEFEAEALASIVTERIDLTGSSVGA
jgi:hypothetical protein